MIYLYLGGRADEVRGNGNLKVFPYHRRHIDFLGRAAVTYFYHHLLAGVRLAPEAFHLDLAASYFAGRHIAEDGGEGDVVRIALRGTYLNLHRLNISIVGTESMIQRPADDIMPVGLQEVSKSGVFCEVYFSWQLKYTSAKTQGL